MSGEKARAERTFDAGTAATISLFAGIWMLIGPITMHAFDWDELHEGHLMHDMRPWVWHDSLLHGYVSPMGWPLPGVPAGLIVLVASILLFVYPRRHVLWGIVILIVSAIVMLTSMGGIVPGVLGVVGGGVALMPAGSRLRGKK